MNMILIALLISPVPDLQVKVEYKTARVTLYQIMMEDIAIEGVTLSSEDDPVEVTSNDVPVALINVSTSLQSVTITNFTNPDNPPRQIKTNQFMVQGFGEQKILVSAVGGIVGEEVTHKTELITVNIEDPNAPPGIE